MRKRAPGTQDFACGSGPSTILGSSTVASWSADSWCDIGIPANLTRIAPGYYRTTRRRFFRNLPTLTLGHTKRPVRFEVRGRNVVSSDLHSVLPRGMRHETNLLFLSYRS